MHLWLSFLNDVVHIECTSSTHQVHLCLNFSPGFTVHTQLDVLICLDVLIKSTAILCANEELRLRWSCTISQDHLGHNCSLTWKVQKNSYAGWNVGDSLQAIYKYKCDKKTIFWSKKDKWFPLRIAVKDKLIGVLTLMRRTQQLLRQNTFIKNDITLVPLNKLIWYIHFRFPSSSTTWFELQ